MRLHPMFRSALACLGVFLLLSSSASLQQKGGEQETGPYQVVANWPQPWA
jgi:hypothetical protein